MPAIKLLKRAELELIDACGWYEKQKKGLSLNLRKDIKRSIRSIELNPKIFAKRFETELRFIPLSKFPFVVVYWFDEVSDTVFITSIFHTKRNPEGFK